MSNLGNKSFKSDFEHLKVWQDNPDLDYYLSESHWNHHVNQLLYTYLKNRYMGNEVGVYINIGLFNGFEATKIDYNQIYGVMFNEAYSFCSYVLTTPVPETKITKLLKLAEGLCDNEPAKPIISYNILVMTGLILCYANDQNDDVDRFLKYLSNHNGSCYFGDEFHHFENYIKIGLETVAATMIDSRLQPPGKLRSGYDYKGRHSHLCKTIPYYRLAAEKLEKRVEEANKNQVEGSGDTKRLRLGRKKKVFKEYIINVEETYRIIKLIKKKINKNDLKQVALVIIGCIEAGKIRKDVTSTSIEEEFGVNGNSLKPHLTKYRHYKNGLNDYYSEDELKPYKDFFSD